MLTGTYVALVTPFKDGKIDEKSFKRLINFVIDNGCQGVVPCGTTGESATLDFDEHERVISLAMEYSDGRVKVMAGTGSNSTAEAIKLTKFAEKVKADYALLITPYYNKPTQKGLYEHFKAISDECEIPLVIYNVPSRTGVNITADTILSLSQFKNIVGVKEASGNLKQIQDIIGGSPENFSVLSGDDGLTFLILALGGKGVISVTANLLPKMVSDMVSSFLAGRFEESKRIHYKLAKMNEVLFIETNPAPVKAALFINKIIESGELRLPLVPVSENNFKIIQETLNYYK